MPFGSGRDAVPIPLQFANLKWLSPYISHRLSVSNFNTEGSDGVASEEEKLQLDLQCIADHDNSVNNVDCFDGTRRNDESSCRSTTPSVETRKTYLRPKRELLLNQRNRSLVMGWNLHKIHPNKLQRQKELGPQWMPTSLKRWNRSCLSKNRKLLGCNSYKGIRRYEEKEVWSWRWRQAFLQGSCQENVQTSQPDQGLLKASDRANSFPGRVCWSTYKCCKPIRDDLPFCYRLY